MVSHFWSRQLGQLKQHCAAPVPALCEGFDAQTVARIMSFWKHRSAESLDAKEHSYACWTALPTTPFNMFDDGRPMLSLVPWPADDWRAAAQVGDDIEGNSAVRLMPWHVIPWDKHYAGEIRALPITHRPATQKRAKRALIASLQHESRSQLRQDPTSAWYVVPDVPAATPLVAGKQA